MHPPYYVALGLADAALSGAATPRAVRTRCAKALGRGPVWLRALSVVLTRLFSRAWHDGSREPLAEAIMRWPGFLESWGSDDPPMLRFHFLRPRRMLPRPLVLQDCALPNLPTVTDVAAWLGLEARELEWLADVRGWEGEARNERMRHYTYRWVPKRAGGKRLLEIPKPWLRLLQGRILRELLEYVPPHESAHGFRARHSPLTNASRHVGQSIVVRMDLQDFFVSVGAARVRALFSTLGYPHPAASMLAGLCTNRAPAGVFEPARPDAADPSRMRAFWTMRKRFQSPHLPQGAPSSPALANLCAFNLDVRLQALADAFEARYTRYADDITFSGGARLLGATLELRGAVEAIAQDEGFSTNLRKTRVMARNARQSVTGVVVNEHPNVGRNHYDRLKAILHNCARHGARTQNRAGVPDFRAHLRGRVAHVAALNPARGERLRELFERIRWSE